MSFPKCHIAKLRPSGIVTTILLFCSFFAQATWTNQNTGINDDLNGIIFWPGFTNGIVSGNHGIYYTTSGSLGASNWHRFTISGNAADSLLYNSTHFYKIASKANNVAYICGWDTVGDRGVILKFDLSALTYNFVYVGSAGSKLNGIAFEAGNPVLLAVGNNGLLLRSTNLVNFISVNSGTTNDLYAITSDVTGLVYFGGTGGVYIHGTDNGTIINLTTTNFAGANIKAFIVAQVGGPIAVGDAVYTFPNGNSLNTNTYFDFPPLSANGASCGNGYQKIATDHGIYVPQGTTPVYELQVSSAGYSLNDVYTLGYGFNFAAGKNGVVLFSSTDGGPTKPYCGINFNGTCQGVNVVIPSVVGTANNYTWYVNGVWTSTASSLVYNFPSLGSYTLTLIVSNFYGNSDTAKKVVQIIPQPGINLATTVSDSFLCKSEAITISLANSENNFNYYLCKMGTGNTFGSAPGNGGTLTFTSNPISQGGDYYIKVQSNTYQCALNFSDSIFLVVEKTKANFHASLINAEPGETVYFKQLTYQAQNYQWFFSPGASMAQSTLPLVSNNFSILGPNTTTLVASSSHGCYDTIIKNGPYIYQEPTSGDSCWTIKVNSTENLSTFPKITSPSCTAGLQQMLAYKKGFLLVGMNDSTVFESHHGDSYGKTTDRGAYLAYYTRSGTLKWYNEAKITTSSSSSFAINIWVTKDANDQIYFAGKTDASSYYFDNSGDSMNIAVPALLGNSSETFVARVDSLGILRSRYIIENTVVSQQMKTDHANNLILTGFNSAKFRFVSPVMDTVIFDSTFSPANASILLMMKIDTAGYLKWYAGASRGSNFFSNLGMVIDKDNSIYLGGTLNWPGVYFYSADLVYAATDTFSLTHSYVAKYDSSGIFQWFGALNIDIYDMCIDNNDGIYIVGGQNANIDSLIYVDGQQKYRSNKLLNGYAATKIDRDGNYKWSAGINNPLIGPTFGYSCAIKDSVLITAGMVYNYNTPDSVFKGRIYSSDGTYFTDSLANANAFILTYDTAGKVRDYAVSGYCPREGYLFAEYMYIDDDWSLYIAGNFQQNVSATLVEFNDTLNAANLWGSGGFVAKVQPGCMQHTNGVHELPLALNSALVFPNPSNGLFTVQTSSLTKKGIRLFDIVGKEVYSGAMRGREMQFNFQSVRPGIYFMEVEDNGSVYTLKIIVQP